MTATDKQTTARIAPRTATERAIHEFWAELLNSEEIGIDDKFLEVGGNSKQVLLMFSMIDDNYPGRVKIADLFTMATIREIAAHLDEHGDDEVEGVEL